MKLVYKIKKFSHKVEIGDWVITKHAGLTKGEWGRKAYKVLDRSPTTATLTHHRGTILLKNIKKVGSKNPNIIYED